MFQNKKTQGMVVDLILLVLITSMFFIFLGTQITASSSEIGAVRSRNIFNQNLLFTTLNYKTENPIFGNSTILEIITGYHCGFFGYSYGDSTFLMDELNSLMDKSNRQNNYFILVSESDFLNGHNVMYACSPEIEAEYDCCIRTERVSMAVVEVPLICGTDYSAKISIGSWPKSMRVEAC